MFLKKILIITGIAAVAVAAAAFVKRCIEVCETLDGIDEICKEGGQFDGCQD